jgi:hypothetical protein
MVSLRKSRVSGQVCWSRSSSKIYNNNNHHTENNKVNKIILEWAYLLQELFHQVELAVEGCFHQVDAVLDHLLHAHRHRHLVLRRVLGVAAAAAAAAASGRRLGLCGLDADHVHQSGRHGRRVA